jgi:hypothetical protein
MYSKFKKEHECKDEENIKEKKRERSESGCML